MIDVLKVFKKLIIDYPLKILGVNFNDDDQEIQIETHLLWENATQKQSLDLLLEDETAIKLINPKDLMQLKEIQTLYSNNSEKIYVTQIYFDSNEVEIFYVDPGCY